MRGKKILKKEGLINLLMQLTGTVIGLNDSDSIAAIPNRANSVFNTEFARLVKNILAFFAADHFAALSIALPKISTASSISFSLSDAKPSRTKLRFCIGSI